MDGAERAFGTPVEAEFCGKKYLLRPRMARNFGDISRKILDMRPDPVEMGRRAYLAATGDPVAQEIQARIYAEMAIQARFVTRIEQYTFLNNTVEGSAFVLYLALRKDQPEITEEDALYIMLEDMEERAYKLIDDGIDEAEARARAEKEAIAHVEDTINTAGGEDWRGNSTGSPPTPQETSPETSTSPSTGE